MGKISTTQVGNESWYNHSGFGRGVDPDVAADLGYPTPRETAEIAENIPYLEIGEPTRKALGSVSCGDCLQVIPCSHVGVRRDGTRFTRGY